MGSPAGGAPTAVRAAAGPSSLTTTGASAAAAGESAATRGSVRTRDAVRARDIAHAEQPTAIQAVVGERAPAFSLPAVDGTTHSLEDYRGKIVVLEWYNPDCPFVRQAHGTDGALRSRAARATADGIVWLAVNSSAPGTQGHGLARNQASLSEYDLAHPILLDEAGTVGHVYGATNTPHLFVVAPDGTLAYAGALDNLPYGEQRERGSTRHYLDEALTALREGRIVATPQTRAWDCTVKYAR